MKPWQLSFIALALGGYFGAGLGAIATGDVYHAVIRLPISIVAIVAMIKFVSKK